MPWREKLASKLMPPFDAWVRSVPGNISSKALDIRIFEDQRPLVCTFDSEYLLADEEVSGKMLLRLAAHISGYSLYLKKQELENGFLSMDDGFRAGVFGCCRMGGIGDIYGICIRIPRQIKGCAEAFFDRYFVSGIKNTIIISPPGMGKTTFLRDIVRLVSDSGKYVGLCDERSEISGAADIGSRTMVMKNCGKAKALLMLTRSCSPNVLACDEIGGSDDAMALLEAAKSGVKIIATAHGADLSYVKNRNGIKELFDADVFECYVQLGKRPGNVEAMGCVRRQGF